MKMMVRGRIGNWHSPINCFLGLIVLLILALLQPSCSRGQRRAESALPPSGKAQPFMEMETDFLEGEVRIMGFDYFVTRFQLTENGAVVDVRNDIHIRLVENPYDLPVAFSILAPMTAVKVVKGKVPASYIRQYPLKHYLSLRERYDRWAR